MVGRESSDDAGVVRLNDQTALIQTVDFFTPILDDPFFFGQAAAANALSDVYAMGGQPLTAMNIVCFPIKEMDEEILGQILAGGLDKIREAGALLVGGHSIEDKEIKYGLSVTGLVHPDKVVTNSAARPGQELVLTKPLGLGILSTALKGGLAPAGAEERMIEVMTQLNGPAAEAMVAAGVRAATDITGFGLTGHALELARGSKVCLEIKTGLVPVLDDVVDLARMGLVPAGSHANRAWCASAVRVDESIDPFLADVMADAQTSGGLLMAVESRAAEDLMTDLESRGVAAALIGRVTEGPPGTINLIP